MAKLIYGVYDLQLFAEGGAGAGASGAAAAGAEGGTSDAAGVTAAAAGQRKGAKNPLANVVYGKQEQAADAGAGQVQQVAAAADKPDAASDRQAQYNAFRQEFKAELDADTQNIVQRRLKSTKETVERYEKLAPVLEILASKYGVDAGDADAIRTAIEDDDSYFEQEALEKGMSVADLKAVKKMERENAALKQQIEQSRQKAQVEADVARWMAEAEEAKKVFPGLDLGRELQNPQFLSLLRSNIDLQTAYFAVHNRELVPQVMQYTAAKTQQNVAQSIQAGANRPTENAITPSSTAVIKSDVSKLSKEDRAEIRRRVERGERIVF